MNRTLSKLALLVAGAEMALATNVAFGQEQESATTMEEVVITGSRITRKDMVSPSPLVTTDMAEVSVSGRPSVDDYLKDLPQFGAGTGDYSNDSNAGTGAGRATLNLRNLGAKRNLIIMDGRRLMPSGTDGAIDINTIPSLAIGSIEVITGGASATYGSDALSGVVNFRTRTDLDGFEIDVQGSSLDDTGEDTYKIGAAFGTEYAGGKGSLLLSAEYKDRGGVRYRDRDFFMAEDDSPPQASSFIAYGLTRSGPSTWSVDNGGNVFDSSDIDAANKGLFTDSIEEPLLIRGDDLRTIGAYNNFIQVPLEQTTLFGKTDYVLDNGVTAYGQLLYATSTAYNEGAAPISAGVGTVLIPFNNYYLQQHPDFIAAARVRPSGIENFQQRWSQLGGRVYEAENDVYQITGGLKGQIGDRDLNWDIHASFGKTETKDITISGAGNTRAAQEIVDSTDPLTGESPLCSGGYNPFGGTDPFSPNCLAYISRTPVNTTTLEQTVLEGVLEGKLTDMPAGEARFALSANYRENTYDFDADTDIENGELANMAFASDMKGNIEVWEVAGEVLLPLVSGGGAIDAMNLTLGARFSDYDPAGTTETFKSEVDVHVNEHVMLRGGFQRAVRAPNVEEFFRASLYRVSPFLAPCSARYRGVSLDRDAELGLCAEMGASPNFQQGGSSAPTITNGNLDLEPEEADTFTLGLVTNFALGAADVKLTVDYYNIEIDKAIETMDAQLIMTKCFNLDGASNPGYDVNYFPCQQLTFTQGGTFLEPVNLPVLNLGGIETAGFDVTASFHIPVESLAWGGGSGSISFRSSINILNKHEIQSFTDEGFVDFAGVVSTNVAYPELKMFNSLTVETGPITLSTTWRHISEMDDFTSAAGSTTVEGADSYDYFDLTARVQVGEQFEVYGGVYNFADKKPPQIGGLTADSGTNEGVYDAIGRSFYLGVRANF